MPQAPDFGCVVWIGLKIKRSWAGSFTGTECNAASLRNLTFTVWL